MASAEKRGNLGRVVVIGGNGFLGHHIINIALEQWTTSAVTSIDLRCTHNVNEAASYHECDITDTAKLAGLLQTLKADVVIHTASPTASGDTKSSKELFRKVNVEGTKSVIEACQKASVKALVYTSSASILSDNESDLYNASEDYPVIRAPQQKEYYSETKAAAEELVLKANRESPYNLLTTSIRPAGIFGEGDVQNLSNLIRVYKTGKSNIQLGDNTNIFDFTYVGNIAHAHLLAARLLLASAAAYKTIPLDHERVDGEAFIITNDSPVYFWDFARAVWRAAGKEQGTEAAWVLSREFSLIVGSLAETFYSIIGKPPTFTKMRATFANMTRYYNINKAKRTLKYEPIWTLQEGVNKGVAWFLEQEKTKAQ